MVFCFPCLEAEEPTGSGYCPELAVQWGYHLTLGGRMYMEDYHTAEVRLLPDGPVGLFAIYDGHGGCKCVQFVRSKLYTAILDSQAFQDGQVETAMREAYLKVDQEFAHRKRNATCGTTATTILQRGRTLWVAHVGDSRAVLATSEGAFSLTKDHKPDDQIEADRIRAMGGHITTDDVLRVGGILAVTRAFGNNAMKATITAEPEVMQHHISQDDQFVIVASDGVWDVLSNDDAANVARTAPDCKRAAEMIATEAYRRGSMDNISSVVLNLNYQNATSSQRLFAHVRISSQKAALNWSQRGSKPASTSGGNNAQMEEMSASPNRVSVANGSDPSNYIIHSEHRANALTVAITKPPPRTAGMHRGSEPADPGAAKASTASFSSDNGEGLQPENSQ